MLDISPPEVTPEAGEGALGGSGTGPDTALGQPGPLNTGTRLARKPTIGGEYMSQHLNLTMLGKAAGGQAKVRTGLGKSDRPGS